MRSGEKMNEVQLLIPNSHTEGYPRQTGPQSLERVLQFRPLFREVRTQHVLQFCPLFREARTQQWPHGATLQEQLWGKMEGLLKTTTFIQTTGLTI